MSFLVIDTETNGLFDFSQPADAPGQPRLAHLAMIFLDASGAEERRDDIYVRPDGWSMTAEATKVNGLTDEFLAANGEDVREALAAYRDAIVSDRVIVAFNAQYDCKVMRGEFRRASLPDFFEQTRNICVMRPMTKICRIPHAGRPGLKFPNLGEALAHFGHERTGAHQAMSDAEGAATIFRELMIRDLLPVASVHYAKEKPTPKPAAPRRGKAKRPAPLAGGLF